MIYYALKYKNKTLKTKMLIIDDLGGPPQQINGKRFISKSK